MSDYRNEVFHDQDFLKEVQRLPVEALKQLSYTKYGKDRAEVEALILAKYQKPNLTN